MEKFNALGVVEQLAIGSIFFIQQKKKRRGNIKTSFAAAFIYSAKMEWL
jgi:hypothetical protein